MKNILILLVVAALAVGAYLYIAKPELLGIEKVAPDPATTTQPTAAPSRRKKDKPATPKPQAKRGSLSIPDNLTGPIYLSGKEIKPGLNELAAGEYVVTHYAGEDRYSLQHVAIKAGEQTLFDAQPVAAKVQANWQTFQGNRERSGFVKAARRQSLQPVWQKDFSDLGKVQSAPILVDGTAYFSTENALLVALDVASGDLKWRTEGLGSSVSPIASSDYVFIGNVSGQFAGFRTKDGKQRGETGLDSYALSLAFINDEAFLAATRSNQLYSIKTDKNFFGRLPLKINWEKSYPALRGSTAPPLIMDDRAIYQGEAGMLLAVSLSDGSQIWPNTAVDQEQISLNAGEFVDDLKFLTLTPVTDGKQVYAATKDRIFSVNASDGSENWSTKLDWRPTTALSMAYGMLFVGDSDGKLRALSAKDGKQIYAAPSGSGPIFTAPVIFDGQVLLGDRMGILRLHNAFDGSVVGEADQLKGAAMDATPAVSGNLIFAINQKGRAAAFQ